MTDHDSIAEILGEWREQQDRGIPVDPEEVIEAHPDLAEELRLSFAALAVLERDAVLDIEVLPGERLGDYRIVRELGRGGQAVVYLAEGSGQERRRVALKVLTGPWRHSEVALRRLCREADVASRLDHPGICEVYETGTAEGVPFIAMEYVEGQTLAKCLSQRVARSVSPKGGAESEGKRGATRQSEVTTSRASGLPDRARIDRDVEVIEKVAGAVHAAHHAGIVHRDLKPGNIMVRPDGEPVILDFGLAAVASTETTAITGPGELFGTLPYMSPEQIARRDIPLDARTDVYSLGVVLYECLTLRRPFEAPTREGLHRAILERVPPDPCRLNRTIPKGLRVILETALAKERQHRYQTALSFAEDLAAFREGRTLAARRAPAIVRAWRWSRREPLRAALLLAVLLATALAGYLVARWPDLRRGREQVQRQRIEGLLEEGFLELGEGSPDKALACFQEVLQRDPMVAEAVAGFALKHFLGGEPEGLLEVLDRHGAVTEGRSGLLRLRAAALRAVGQTTQALEAERKAGPARSALDQFIVGSLAMVEGHRGDPQGYRSALAAFTRAILRSQHARALYHLEQAHAAGHVRDAPTAREAAAALEVLWPDSFQALFRRGYALQAVDPDAAIACYLRALELRPDRPVLYENIGFCYAEKSQPEEAVAWYRKALGLRESATAHRGVAQALGSMGRGEEAITEFQAALALEWTSRGADQLGRSLLDIGRHDAAMAVYQEMLDLEIDPVRALNGLALALNYKGELGPAVERLREALEVSPDDVDTRYNLGNVLSDQGLRSDAIAAYRKVIALDPDHAFAHHNLGKMLLDGGQVEEGLREMRRAIELAPDFRLARYNLGTALIERDRVEEGLAELRKVVEVASGSVEAALCRGILLFHSGSLGPAVEQFQGVLERVGRDPVWRGAVELWLQEARDLLQAETRLASILAGDGHPRDAADRDDLVRICLLGGRHHLAARLWREWIARVTSSGGVPGPGQRAQAACFAAMAGTGGAREDLDDDAQAQWRQQALVWLREDLEACRNSFERGRLRESRLSRILEDWRSREGLAGVRAAEALSRLPATERAAWTLLWKRVDELLAEVQ